MAELSTVAVHRCRFVDYTPSAITALAFPPLPLPSTKGKQTTSQKQLKFGTLAVGHANGNIDLCEWAGGERDFQSSQAWVVRKVSESMYPSYKAHRMPDLDATGTISFQSGLSDLCDTLPGRLYTRRRPILCRPAALQLWWGYRTIGMGYGSRFCSSQFGSFSELQFTS